WTAHCDSSEHLRVKSTLLLEQIPSHLHFATLRRDGAPVAEHLLTQDAPTWEIAGDASARSAGLRDFIALGVRHVATGVDHLVFMLALLVAASSLRAVAGVVTGFTIGHSATLAMAVLGGVRPDIATIEALVGASIAVVAAENVWLERRDPWVARGIIAGLALVAVASAVLGRGSPIAMVGLALFVACYFGLLWRSERPARLRWSIAALFGTVHGFAFSGALAEMSLPRARLASALFGFNVGVELAQLALVALAWPLWQLVARTPARPRVLVLASAAALSAGAFWLIDRTFG
ncbi:MAG TPA: HupE/UreJ family protein, partial [Labilithrix sp.]|nr:HupE/UreJ family protein [Labilithrix sp.]